MRASLCVLFAVSVIALVLSAAVVESRPTSSATTTRPHHKHGHRKAPTLDLRPIIGIFSLANSDSANETGSIIPAGYVKWLEQAGARVAVVPFNAPKDVLDKLFDGLNGLLFTGGGLSLDADTFFFQQALYLFNKAKAANDAGDVFPIWGSCQGFQMLHLLAAQPSNHASVLKCNIYNSTNLVLPLNFTDAAPMSQLFGPAQLVPAIMDGESMHPTIYEVLATQAITQNLHNCGINPVDFNADPILPNFYQMLSTNVDLNGLPFVSSIEGIKYPFMATQWHAERTQFEWDLQEDLVHDAQSIAVHAYMAQRWMMFARQSAHRFQTEAQAEQTLIYNYTPTYTGGDPDDHFPDRQTYEFEFTALDF